MSGMYGASDERESIATIHAAVAAGINLLDTGDFYGLGHNESLIGRALKEGRIPRDKVVLSVKFGALRSPDGQFIGFDGRPASVKAFLAYSLQRLGVEYVDIYRPSRLDPSVPIEDTMGAITDMIKAGYVRHAGLSEVGAATIRRAHAVQPIVDLQIEHSLIARKPEATIFPTLRELGVGVTAYGVLSRGLLTGVTPGENDFRAHLPRFSQENLAHNRRLATALVTLAQAKAVTPAQLCIAWSLRFGGGVVPLLGARTRKQLDEALGALHVQLSDDDVMTLERTVAPEMVAGDRYHPFQMSSLDSERA